MRTWMWVNAVVILSSLPLLAVSQRATGIVLVAGTISTCARMTFSDRRRR